MIANSEAPPSADTSRFNASLERGWGSILIPARSDGRDRRPSHACHIEIFKSAITVHIEPPYVTRALPSPVRSSAAMTFLYRGLTGSLARVRSFSYEHNQLDLRLLRFRPRHQSSIHGGGDEAWPHSRREQYPARLWRRLGRTDGSACRIGPRPRRIGYWGHSGLPGQSRAHAAARAGAGNHARHARAQTGDVRARGRLRRTAGGRGNARGTG